MSEHNESSSSDESWTKLALPYDEFDILLTDMNETELAEIGHAVNDVVHLSPGTFSSPAFPAYYQIYGPNIRYMVPLVCQRAGHLVPCRQWFTVHLFVGEVIVYSANATHTLYTRRAKSRSIRTS